jgi:Domain of unknown function (DUF1707)
VPVDDDPRIRASDEERDRTAALLREHHAVGRLGPEEFAERLDRVYRARTVGDLDDLLSDLPGIDLYRLPHQDVPRYQGSASTMPYQAGAVAPAGRFSPAWLTAWGTWAALSAVTFVLWLAAGAGFPWFLLIAGPAGLVLLARWLAGRSHPG